MKRLLTVLLLLVNTLFISAQKTENTFTYSPPSPPAIISKPSDRQLFIVQNYWNKFPFQTPSIAHQPTTYEQAFADYVYLLQQIPNEQVESAVTAALNLAAKGKENTLKTFVDLFNKYLYDPNSPLRDEERYIPVLQYIIASPLYKETEKIRPKHQLKLALRNRVGNKATDITVTLANQSQIKLSQIRTQYTLLFFNNPDCHDCIRVKQFIERNQKLNELIAKKQLTLLSVYPDKELQIWQKTVYPKSWINSYDATQSIQNQTLYDLKAMPCLYLLNNQQIVLLKDAPIEKIADYLLKQ